MANELFIIITKEEIGFVFECYCRALHSYTHARKILSIFKAISNSLPVASHFQLVFQIRIENQNK